MNLLAAVVWSASDYEGIGHISHIALVDDGLMDGEGSVLLG